jgi:hypothetical protein
LIFEADALVGFMKFIADLKGSDCYLTTFFDTPTASLSDLRLVDVFESFSLRLGV